MLLKIKVFIILMFCSSLSLMAQTWEIGVTAGSMSYLGDLNQNNLNQFKHFAGGGMLKRNFDGYWSIKFSTMNGQISANDATSNLQQQQDRNLSFFTPISETSLLAELNFFDYGFDFRQKRLTPFLSAGISLITFNPKTDYNGNTYDLKEYNTEGQITYKTTTFSIPIGTGVKYNFGRYFNVIGEIGFRTTNTDYLDDVSGYYPDPSLLQSSSPIITNLRIALSDRSINKIGAPNTQRGDFRKKDSYLFAGISLTYTFVSQKCPF
jgi:hypothetical protein